MNICLLIFIGKSINVYSKYLNLAKHTLGWKNHYPRSCLIEKIRSNPGQTQILRVVFNKNHVTEYFYKGLTMNRHWGFSNWVVVADRFLFLFIFHLLKYFACFRSCCFSLLHCLHCFLILQPLLLLYS